MIAFSGRQLIAHYHEGSSAILLVTFCQLNSESFADERYFLKPQVEHADISCIGVMTSEKGFYLSSEMAEVVRLVEAARRGRPVITFGQSMGGYAAIKHSNALGADFVLALSPYYSMDPDELDLPTERHRKILMHTMSHHGVLERPEFKGMGIREADASGRIAVLYDPSEVIDLYDVGLIKRHLPHAELVPMPHAGHVIYDPTWESDVITTLLTAVQDPDASMFGRTVGQLRRNHRNFLLRSLTKAANRHPLLCARALHAPRLVDRPDFHHLVGDPLNLRLIYLLLSRGDRAEAVAHFAAFAGTQRGLRPQPIAAPAGPPIQTLLRHQHGLLLSTHGSFLAYDPERRILRLEPHVFGRQDLLPVLARMDGDRTMLCIVYDGVKNPPWLLLGADAAIFALELVQVGETQVALRHDDFFLGATPGGEIQLLDRIGHQQRFTVLPALVDIDAPLPEREPQPNASLPYSYVRRPNFARSGTRWRKLVAGA